MKTFIQSFAFVLLLLSTAFAADPTSGQWMFQKKNAGTGFSNFGVTGTNSQAFGLDGSGVPTMLSVGTGTVTSVGVSMPTGTFDVASSPVTGSGTIAITFDNQSDNKVFASPANGSSGQPDWRILVAADIPDLTATYATTAQGTKADNVGAVNGIVKSNGSATFSAAVAGTDYVVPAGNVATATALQTARLINGVSFNGTSNITVTAAAETLTGSALPALNGSALTALNAAQLTSGTVPDARFPATLPAASGANLTALNGSNISTGTVAPARLGSGSSITTKFLRGDSTWQTITAGGTALPGDEVAYVFPETGNDTTGDGSFSTPYATIQKAIEAGKSIIYLGEGNAGTITLTGAADTSIDITVIGLGKDVSFIGAVTGDGNSVAIRDGSYWSFSFQGNISTIPSGDQVSGGITLNKVYVGSNSVLATGRTGTTPGQNGRDAGSIELEHCYVSGDINTDGGDGANGDACTTGGNGGNGASFNVRYSFVGGNISGRAGVGGSDGGAGSGVSGNAGAEANARWSELTNAPASYDGGTSKASLIFGTWTD